MTGVKDRVYQPDPARHAVYADLFKLYRDLHDAFGVQEWRGGLGHAMKRLIEIRSAARKN
jgi:L-ribulokinase